MGGERLRTFFRTGDSGCGAPATSGLRHLCPASRRAASDMRPDPCMSPSVGLPACALSGKFHSGGSCGGVWRFGERRLEGRRQVVRADLF